MVTDQLKLLLLLYFIYVATAAMFFYCSITVLLHALFSAQWCASPTHIDE